MNKCAVSFDDDSLSPKETECVRKCAIKLADSKLLVDNEIFNFTKTVQY